MKNLTFIAILALFACLSLAFTQPMSNKNLNLPPSDGELSEPGTEYIVWTRIDELCHGSYTLSSPGVSGQDETVMFFVQEVALGISTFAEAEAGLTVDRSPDLTINVHCSGINWHLSPIGEITTD